MELNMTSLILHADHLILMNHNNAVIPNGAVVTNGVSLLTLLCGHFCQALWSTFLSFLVSPASLLMRLGLGRAQRGSVHEWVSFSPHSPCDSLRLRCMAHASLSC